LTLPPETIPSCTGERATPNSNRIPDGTGSKVAPLSRRRSLCLYGIPGQQLGKFFIANLSLRNQHAASKVFD
jgi:hypothetical protein